VLLRDSPPRLAAADFASIGVEVRLVVTDPASLEAGTALLGEQLAELDLAASRFRSDSEVAYVAAAGGCPVRVSPLLVGLVDAALTAAVDTGGDVDPTMGAALAGAGYDRDFSLVPVTGPALSVRTRPAPGWRQVALDRQRGLLRVPPGLCLDLGATAKAFAADRAAALLATRLGCGVLVSLGGDIAVCGAPPPGGWQIEVRERPGAGEAGDAAPQVVAITGGGVATSSVLTRSWTRGQRSLHHLLDPRTCQPVRSPVRTATVAAPTCLSANTASTAAVVSGERAAAWLAGRGLPARLVSIDGRVDVVAGWPAPR
jgi:thiamine biosynthesis lipoprotein ApbE